MERFCDAVFEGGGLRGVGLVGAARAFEEQGYKYRRVAGASAGAIVASLLAAGYTAEELHGIMGRLDYEQFKQPNNLLDSFGPVAKFVSMARNFGIYSAQLFENWLEGLLARKGVRTFSDLDGRLKLTASDITDARLLALPDDLTLFGIDPQSFSVAAAVRMSMSIPLFYEPYKLKGCDGRVHFIADGGMLSNYPVWILDDGASAPPYPVFGFRFIRSRSERAFNPNFLEYLKQIITTFMDAHDDEYQTKAKGDAERTVFISTKTGGKNISPTDFDISREQAEQLFKNGHSAATEFLKTWNFEEWKRSFRMKI